MQLIAIILQNANRFLVGMLNNGQNLIIDFGCCICGAIQGGIFTELGVVDRF
ncbi:hypothetical protein SDC9_142196 [bioreactor metagenome]|uniref:Uncharacterized protein n=1 Tax=bioreactor metagenome TaxID=1076179 RepID=A0A645E0G7_9ZZZZ